MTAIHRREMLGVMLGGAVVATAGLALMAVPAEIRATYDEQESSCYDGQPRRRVGSRCAPPPPQGEGVPVASGTSRLSLALDLKAGPVGGFKPQQDSRKRQYGT